MNLLEEFLIGQKHILLSNQIHSYFIHSSCLGHSWMTENNIAILLTTQAYLIQHRPLRIQHLWPML